MKYIRAKQSNFSYPGNNTANFAPANPGFLGRIGGTLGKVGGGIMGAAGAIATPLAIGQMIIPDATTRKVERMRKEDLEREKKGLPPLTTAKQSLTGATVMDAQAPMGMQPQTTSTGNVRVTNPQSNQIIR